MTPLKLVFRAVSHGFTLRARRHRLARNQPTLDRVGCVFGSRSDYELKIRDHPCNPVLVKCILPKSSHH